MTGAPAMPGTDATNVTNVVSGTDTWLDAAVAGARALEGAVREGDWAAAGAADEKLRRALVAGEAAPVTGTDPRIAEIARRHAAALETARTERARLLEAGASLSASRHGTGRYLEVAGAG